MVATADRIQHILPSATLALTAKAKDLKSKGHPVISLAAGEPDFAMPEIAQKALLDALKRGETRYTPTSGTAELKAAVQKKIKEEQGLFVEPSNVVISCGAKHSLYNLIQVLCSPGDEVLIPSPYWVSYPEMVKLAGAKPVLVDTSPDHFLMTRSLIEAAVTPKTRLVILNSPSNPTGAVLKKEHLEDIAKLLDEKKLFCISDEIYEYYVYDGIQHFSIASLVPNFLDRVAIVNGVSKSYAMTGLRIGYTVAHADIVKKIGVLQDHSTSNPASLSQAAACAAMSLGPEYKTRLREDFEKRRNQVLGLLASIPKIQVFRPAGAFYVFIRVKDTGLKPDEFCNRFLMEEYVATIPGESFGAGEWVRLSFAASSKDIEEALGRMKRWIQKI